MYKLKDVRWYNLDPERVAATFQGNPQYIRDFEINDRTWSVYFCDKPNRDLGHKDYMMLGKFGDRWYVSGRSKDEIQDSRFQNAVGCKVCETVIYSTHNHDFHSCSCGATSVDGGRTYTRILGSNWIALTLDLLTGTSFDPHTGEIYTLGK